MSGEATTRQQNHGAEGQPDPARRVKPVPDGFRTVTPYLIVSDVPELVDFLKRVFDAEEISRSTGGSGGGIHSEVRIGNSMLMIGGGGPGFRGRAYLHRPRSMFTCETLTLLIVGRSTPAPLQFRKWSITSTESAAAR